MYGNIVVSSALPVINFSTVNGTYRFKIPTLSYQNTTLVPSTVNGTLAAGSNLIANFTATTVFNETGLPEGVLWRVTYNNLTKTSLTPNNITFSSQYGSHPASVRELHLGQFIYLTPLNVTNIISGSAVGVVFSATPNPNLTTTTSSTTTVLQANSTVDTILSYYNTASISNFTTAQLSDIQALNISQLNSALSMVQSLNSTLNNTQISVVYGNFTQKARQVKAGQQLYYLTKQGKRTAAIHEVVVKKAVPKLNITIAGVTINQPNQTYVLHYPILNGKSTYTINPSVFSSLLGNNTAQFTYTAQIANTVVSSGDVNSSSIAKAFSYSIPSNQSFSLTFETTGNANYTAVDPNVIVLPVNVVFYIPITFTNPSAAATASPFEANVVINSFGNSVYETTSVNNIEFVDGTGNVIKSWLEGNILNENQNTLMNSVVNNQYWVRLPSGIAGSGTVTVYMVFAGNTPSAANTLMDCVNTGEAPQLAFSGVYGSCDTGANVFTNYWNFAGSTLPTGWSRNTLTTKAANVVIANGLEFQGNYAVVNSIPEAITQITEAKVWIRASNPANVMGMAIGSNRLGQVVGGNSVNGGWLRLGSLRGQMYNGIYFPFTAGINALAANQAVPKNDFINMFNGNFVVGETAQPTNIVFYSNGVVVNTIATASNIPLTTKTYQITFGSANNLNGGVPVFYVNWTRQRPYPPSGAVPTISFGTSSASSVTTFTESGLPTGTTWNVVFGGNLLFQEAPNNIAFTTNSGTVLYSVATVTNGVAYTPSPASGSLAAGGTQAISFATTTFTTNFVETGLPSGTTWTVTYNGVSNSAVAPANVMIIAVATWNAFYNVSLVDNALLYNPAPACGSVQSPSNIDIAFSSLAPTVPSGILYYTPLQFQNNQPTAMAANSQINLDFNALIYNSIVESSSMNNIKFFDSTGTIIPSWLLGNTLDPIQNTLLSTSNSLQYWLRILDNGNFLGAYGCNTLFMGFDTNTVSEFTANTGEAPSLSTTFGTYGQFDNGNSVFNGFAGYEGTTQPVGWTCQGHAGCTINNGLNAHMTTGTGTISGNSPTELASLAQGGGIAEILMSTAGSGGAYMCWNTGSACTTAFTLGIPKALGLFTLTQPTLSISDYFTLFVNTPTASAANTVWAFTTEYPPNGVYPDTWIGPLLESAASCTVILSNTAVNFGSVAPASNAPTSNIVADTNGGTAASNILLDGTNWVSGGDNFFASNTVWDFTTHAGGVSGNTLGLATGNLVDTLNVIAPSQLIDMFFGTQVPGLQASGTYTQTITIENLC